MPPPFPEAKITLDYPLYGCDFDPEDPGRLFVGGGGGMSRTGVDNKITSLDASSREKLEITGEITLRKYEDNVASLAAGQRKGRATLLYAGISSGADDLQKGKNEHFRVLSADQPKAAKSSVLGARISELSRTALFTTDDKNTYQRLLRLTQPFPTTSQLGAVATGLSKDPQVALFDVAAGSNVAPRMRGVLDLRSEAVDMDVLQTAEDRYQLIYCDSYNIYTFDVTPDAGNAVDTEPRCIYAIPSDDVRPSFRCIRYLSAGFAFAIANLPSPGGGVVLYGFRLPKANAKPDATARIAVNTKLPRRKGAKATGLAVANLSPPTSPGAAQSDAQFVIAVAANDCSIHLYTLDHQVLGDVDLLTRLFPLRVLKKAHPGMITSLCFSRFIPPRSGTGKTQYLRLASTSVSNCVTVHSIALKKHFDRPVKARRGAGPPRLPRYVTALGGRGPSPAGTLFFFAAVALLIGVLLQGLLEVKGLTRPVVGGHIWLPSILHASPANPPPPPSPHAGFLARLLEERNLAGREHGIVLRDSEVPGGDINLETEHDGSAKNWDELSEPQKALWRDRLKAGGHWAEDMGETVLKGVLFGELAAIVGGVVGG